MCKPVQKAAPSIVNEDGHTVAGISLHIPVYRNRYTALRLKRPLSISSVLE